MSLKANNVIVIPLTTGGTTTIDNGDVALPIASTDSLIEKSCVNFRVEGTQTLASNFIIAMATPTEGVILDVYWGARATSGAFSVTILGKVIPANYHLADFAMRFYCTGGAFVVVSSTFDITALAQIPGSAIADASINTLQVANDAVTFTKIQNVAAYSIPVRDNAAAGDLSSLAIPVQSIFGRIAAGLVAITASVNGTVLKMTAGSIGFSQVNFTELAGTLANAQIPNREIALAKMNSTGLVAHQIGIVGTTAVITEETLFTYTVPANFIAAQGEGLEVFFSCFFASNANAKTLRVRLNGGLQLFNDVTASPNGRYSFGSFILNRGAASNIMSNLGDLKIGDVPQSVQTSASPIDWTIANTLTITGQNGTASANDIQLFSATVKVLR